MRRYVEYLVSSSKDLIRSHPDVDPWGGYGDWLSINADTPKDLIGTAFLATSSRLLSKIAAAVGMEEDAEKYARLSEDVRQAFIRRFISLEGLMAGQTQTACVLALHLDLLPEALRPQVVQSLAADIRSRGNHLSTGFVGAPYLNHALSENSCLDLAYTLLMQKTCPSWLYPVTQGATTIWERWDGWTLDKGFQDPGMNSFNHYAYGSIGDWLYRVVAGINPDPSCPGYKRIILHPRPGGGLTWAAASYKSIQGPVKSAWKMENDRFDWEVIIPANTTAAVYVPVQEGDQVMEGEMPAGQAEGVTFLRFENGSAIFEVASGAYHFRVV
jgi:alpha-L-rhamnosidase